MKNKISNLSLEYPDNNHFTERKSNKSDTEINPPNIRQPVRTPAPRIPRTPGK